MIAVDTNILVRLIVNDDPHQEKRVIALFKKDDIFISKTVLLELEWVLRYAYNLKQEIILLAIQNVLGLPNVTVEDILSVSKAIKLHKSGLDFADALHLSSSRDANYFITFDKKFYKRASRESDISIKCL